MPERLAAGADDEQGDDADDDEQGDIAPAPLGDVLLEAVGAGGGDLRPSIGLAFGLGLDGLGLGFAFGLDGLDLFQPGLLFTRFQLVFALAHLPHVPSHSLDDCSHR